MFLDYAGLDCRKSLRLWQGCRYGGVWMKNLISICSLYETSSIDMLQSLIRPMLNGAIPHVFNER